MMKEIKNTTDKKFPGSKFAIFVYRMSPDCFIDYNGFSQKLNNEGFIIIDSAEIVPKTELAKPEYKTIDVI